MRKMTTAEVMKALKGKTTVSVEVAGWALGLSRPSAYRALRSGEIPSTKIGGRYVVPTAPLRRMLGLVDELA
jgi:excisionase family DNA binding protein